MFESVPDLVFLCLKKCVYSSLTLRAFFTYIVNAEFERASEFTRSFLLDLGIAYVPYVDMAVLHVLNILNCTCSNLKISAFFILLTVLPSWP